ncbi:MAG: M20/M25/M40 family metallo-hydrolase, partial [Bacteroidia bacterium]
TVEVSLIRALKTGRNVIAYLKGKGDKTVFVGAHYDHLGYGEYGNSRYIGEPQIHNGADDNASGVALMLALAGELKASKKLKHNYIFIAFSAEELGLLGSKAYVNNKLYNLYKPIYMMNFDMVGRLNDKNELGLYGTGTSSAWDSVLALVDTSNFVINRNPSGMGSSDHTSFYLNKVPSIHFFSGTHEDYHKPTDDEEKINYEGIEMILDMAIETCLALDKSKGINYNKTKSGKSRKAPSFKVTLGIVPDYFGDAKGLKIDGVSPGKPAEKAGLQKGDIITKLGAKEVKDMMTYMGALAAFDKGDKTTVEVIRAGKSISFDIEF